jgi:sortase A
VILGAFVLYELFGSNASAERAWSTTSADLQNEFQSSSVNSMLFNEVSPNNDPLLSAEPFALMRIPRLWGNENSVPINSGTGTSSLSDGLGHYLGTAFPGNAGNFAVAGHRATHGEPFARFDLLNEGDEVVVETVDGLFTYSLVTDSKVTPEDVWVVGPRPDIDQLKSLPPGSKIITLTTCDPRWSSENRWVWFGVLDSFVPRAEMKEAN